MAKVAFLGLGVMGYPMAGHLKNKGGHEVTVYNRTAAKAENGSPSTAAAARDTPKEAAAGQDFVMACVGNDNDLREVTLGADGAFARHDQGRALRRPHHRLGRDRARAPCRGEEARLRLHRCAGVRRPGRRRERRAHGDVRRRAPSPIARAEKVIAAYARMCKLMGAPGAGQLDQDGQPDLHRRAGAGARRRHPFRQEGRPRRRGA